MSGSDHGPERCLKLMVESMPEMAKVLLDKCVTTEGSKDSRDYKIMYDFFCLEETGMSTDSAQGITRHPLFSIRSQVILLCYAITNVPLFANPSQLWLDWLTLHERITCIITNLYVVPIKTFWSNI